MARALRLSALIAATLAAVSACSTGSAGNGLTPVTGIVVPTARLLRDYRCGAGEGQVLKYAVTLEDRTGAPMAGAVYDCYADATFTNLPPGRDGTYRYVLYVYAYDDATYRRHAATIEAAGSARAVLDATDAPLRARCEGEQRFDVATSAVCSDLEPPPFRVTARPTSSDGGDAGDDDGGLDGGLDGESDADAEL